MTQSLGSISVPGMIYTSTSLTLGSLFLCWLTTQVPNPTIMESALEYPYTIIFRIGMMYSLFITFLVMLFIKWYIDSLERSNHTKKMVFFGAVGLAGYGLFVSCIDRKRINYVYASWGVFLAAVGTSLAISIIMKNLRQNRFGYNNEKSWYYKSLFASAHLIGISGGALIYFGYLDINLKPFIEYLTVISTSLFFWSFASDFKKFKMDIEHIPKPKNLQENMIVNY